MRIFGAADTFDNPVLFSPWSIIHFAIGMAAYPTLQLVDINMSKFILWGIIHGLYELKDILGSYYIHSCKWFIACNKSFASSVGDQIMALLGYALSKGLNISSLWTAGAIVIASFLVLGSPIFDESEKWFKKDEL